MADKIEIIEIIESSGNVFADLGLPDAEELSLKAQLVINLKKLIKKHKLTQREVAERCGTDQPTVSKVLRGQLDKVTVERLVKWLSLLNQEVSIFIKDDFRREEPVGHGRIQVAAC